MKELRNVEADLRQFRLRALVATAAVIVAFTLIWARAYYLQVVQYENLNEQAERNRTAVVPVVPMRGEVEDRNGEILASNYSAYTLEITPSKVPDLDAVLSELEPLVTISKRDRRRFNKLLSETKAYEAIPIRTLLSDEEVARFAAQRWRFPGVEIRARFFRNYPLGATASHLVGYIGRINQREQDEIESWPDEERANYRGTDYIGKLGIEQFYEKELHGETGIERIETSAGGRAVRILDSRPARPGRTIELTIDAKLQQLTEQLFGDRRGALVAIDPRNGEILAFVSAPTFDPNLFVDGIDVEPDQALQLAGDDDHRRRRGVARNHRVGQKVDDKTEPHQPQQELHRAHQQGEGQRQLEVVVAPRWRDEPETADDEDGVQRAPLPAGGLGLRAGHTALALEPWPLHPQPLTPDSGIGIGPGGSVVPLDIRLWCTVGPCACTGAPPIWSGVGSPSWDPL